MRYVVGADEHDPVFGNHRDELRSLGHEVTTVGARPGSPSPWAPVAIEIGSRIAKGEADQGVVCCHTGTGVSMAANKFAGVRAALCIDAETARGARQWNDANVLALELAAHLQHRCQGDRARVASTPYGGTETTSLEAIRAAERK